MSGAVGGDKIKMHSAPMPPCVTQPVPIQAHIAKREMIR